MTLTRTYIGAMRLVLSDYCGRTLEIRCDDEAEIQSVTMTLDAETVRDLVEYLTVEALPWLDMAEDSAP